MEKNGVPEFESEMEAVAWSFKQLSEAVKKYKIPGNDDYSNLKELFDNLYERLNKLEEDSAINGSIHRGDR